jgi:hypothetical protein
MRIINVSLGLVLVTIGSCHQFRPAPPPEPSPDSRPTSVAWDWAAHLGETVTLEGFAIDRKFGAQLWTERGDVWIDNLPRWPEGFYSGGDKGKRLRVTGTLIKRDDMPVFVQKLGGVVPQGIAVTEQELEQAKWRYLLQDANWTVLE